MPRLFNKRERKRLFVLCFTPKFLDRHVWIQQYVITAAKQNQSLKQRIKLLEVELEFAQRKIEWLKAQIDYSAKMKGVEL